MHQHQHPAHQTAPSSTNTAKRCTLETAPNSAAHLGLRPRPAVHRDHWVLAPEHGKLRKAQHSCRKHVLAPAVPGSAPVRDEAVVRWVQRIAVRVAQRAASLRVVRGGVRCGILYVCVKGRGGGL